MENKGTDFSEEWIKIKKDDIPEGEYIGSSVFISIYLFYND